jgi:hypothetical protein
MSTDFSYHKGKEGKVFLFWRTKLVKILKGKQGRKFMNYIYEADWIEAQCLMAKFAGDFKR